MLVLTWNIWGRNADWKAREKALISSITEIAPDVVVFQEAWREDDGRGQMARLAKFLDFSYHVQADPPPPAEDRGLGVIARWPISRHEAFDLPAAGEPSENRIALYVDIATPEGALPLITTHLNWRPDHSAVRQEQASHIIRKVAGLESATWPVIVCGDFNAEPESDEIRLLTGRTPPPISGIVFQDAWVVGGDDSAGHTWSRSNPHAAAAHHGPGRIDYVFVQWRSGRPGPIRAARLIHGLRRGVWASDHAGLVVELVDDLAPADLAPADPTDPPDRPNA